jgi:hypothetical protein
MLNFASIVGTVTKDKNGIGGLCLSHVKIALIIMSLRKIDPTLSVRDFIFPLALVIKLFAMN